MLIGLFLLVFIIEYANRNKWENVWLETDSALTIHASKLNIVPWHLLFKWLNTLHVIHSIRFNISHILK